MTRELRSTRGDRQDRFEKTLVVFARKIATFLSAPGVEEQTATDGPLFPGYQHGSAGVASFLVQAGRSLEEPLFLDAADRWLLVSSERAAVHGFGARGSSYQLDGHHDAFFVGPASLAWVTADLADARGDIPAREAAVERLASLLGAGIERSISLDLTRGLSGHLEAVAECRRRCTAFSAREDRLLNEIAAVSLARVLDGLGEDQQLERSPGVGFAHGWPGAVWAAIHWAPDDDRVKSAVEKLISLCEIDADIAFWPPSVLRAGRDTALASSWCNGVAGMAQLFCRAHRTRPDGARRAVLEACVVTLARPLPMDASLCCGSAGVALTLHDAADCLSAQPEVRPLVEANLRRAMRATDLGSPRLFRGAAGIGIAALAVARGGAGRPLGFAP
jgi:lantibiotic modifying enzyme